MTAIGVLLTNTGTPDAATPHAIRRYLREFLSDKRVVKLPKLIWLPILYGLVLPLRPYKATKLYKSIWTAEGAPMRLHMQAICDLMQTRFNSCSTQNAKYYVEVGMNYGNPSIANALAKLQQKQVSKIIVLPLYPQYSNATTASSFDRTIRVLKQWPALPEIAFIHSYADNSHYINALAQSVLNYWATHERSPHLLISFHGIPERFIKNGDPYQTQCEQTAKLLAEALKLSAQNWSLCYQSKFGYDKWLRPATVSLLREFAHQDLQHIDIICPGFSVDCLETLEEIKQRLHETFLSAGGKSLRYIPALNSDANHIDCLTKLIGGSN